jgi:hypothetical protein
MMRKWFAVDGTWVFIIVVVGGFGLALYHAAPWSLAKRCVNVSPPEETPSWLTDGRGLPSPDPGSYEREASHKALWEQCQQLKQHQSRKKD